MRIAPILTVALVMAAGCASPEAPPRTVPQADLLDEEARAQYLAALEDESRGRHEKALDHLEDALAARPLHVPSHLLRQDLLQALGQESVLATEYAALAETLPSDAAAAVLAVRAAGGEDQDRITAYQGAAALDPANPWPRVALAVARSGAAGRAGDTAEARARAGFPDEAAVLREEARIGIERAVVEAERAVATAPSLSVAHGVLGHVLSIAARVSTGDSRERRQLRSRARDAWDEALARDPGDPALLLGRAMLLRDLEMTAEAQADLDLASLAAPRDPVVLAMRARNLDDGGAPPAAAAAWKEAVRISPRDPDLVVEYAGALARAERWGDALRQYREADDLFPQEAPGRWKVHRGLATVFLQMGLEGREQRLLDAAEQLRLYLLRGGAEDNWARQMRDAVSPAVTAPEGIGEPGGDDGS